MNPEVIVGNIIAQRYRIVRIIGKGGMGVVVAAEDRHLGREVALKFLHGDATPVAFERLVREAEALVQFKGEHFARVIDVQTLPDGMPYIVMELLRGQNLHQLLSERGLFDIEQAVDYVLQTCEALAEAHALGFVHRDIKPSNLFLTTRVDGSPCVKLIDFGISKVLLLDEDLATLTRTGSSLGTPRFAAPEQLVSARDVDARSDIWALGATLYQLVTGRLPFPGDKAPLVCAAIQRQEPVAVRDYRPDAPAQLAAVIARCLAKDRADRLQNVAQLAKHLAPFGLPTAQSQAERIRRTLEGPAVARSVQAPAHADASAESAPATTVGVDMTDTTEELTRK